MIIGIGIDLVEVVRIERLLARKGERARRRIFTDAELAYCDRRADPVRSLAARVAAKEAAFKALAGSEGARAIAWRELEVTNGSDGRPTLRLHGAAAARAAALGVTRSWTTLTHSATAAAAVVVLEGP
jgi:holo-[acyl-carrier protein] synthase